MGIGHPATWVHGLKQTLFMVVVTAFGALGAFGIEPYVGVAVYYFFAVLRPQYMWAWALPSGIGWSGYVAWATMAATLWWAMSRPPSARGQAALSAPHKAVLIFGAWICLTYVTALNQAVAWPWFLEYLKLFVMFAVAAFALREVRQIWWVYRLAAIALIYISYEVNYLYLVNGRLDIFHNGYGGLDNNGAGLMLAMGIPLAIHAWEGTRRVWRWAYIAAVPLMMHAVLMTYSRGAMVSLLASVPLLFLRSNRKKQFSLALVLLLATVPYLAGKEIRDRFFSVQQYQTDGSARARFSSWQSAVDIANDYPIFGVGIRNSNLLSFRYGADIQGRTIHSQYLQTLADAGYPGLAFYLIALALTWLALRQARRALRERTDDEAFLARSMLSGVEGSLLIFCIGASFLSLEVFELPYLLLLVGAQIAALSRSAAVSTASATRLERPRPAVIAHPAFSSGPRMG